MERELEEENGILVRKEEGEGGKEKERKRERGRVFFTLNITYIYVLRIHT